MIASLPMYWREENADLWRDFWGLVQEEASGTGLDLPDLTPPDDIPAPWTDHWLRDDLILSQTCSLPFRTALRNRVTYVGTLDFGLNAPPGHYYSRLITRTDPVAKPGRNVLAYNGPDSQSGWAVAQKMLPSVTGLLETGSHAASLRAVAEGAADIAYVDAVTWRIARQFDQEVTDGLRVASNTAPSPGLPLITNLSQDPKPLREALRRACLRCHPKHPHQMGGPLTLTLLDPEQYLSLEVPEPPAP